MKGECLIESLQELNFSPYNKTAAISGKRYFVPTSSFSPADDCGINIKTFLDILNQRVFCDFIQELVFHNEDPTQNIATVKQLTWSPVFEELSHTSVLTVLNNLGSLEFNYFHRGNWNNVVSVSKLWLEYWKATWTVITTLNEVDIINIFKERTNRVRITSFVWGSKVGSSREVWYSLYTSNYCGEVAIWKVKPVVDELLSESNISLFHVIKTELGHITSLCHQDIVSRESLLVICGNNGKIQSIPVGLSSNPFKIGLYNTIWNEEDKIPTVPNGYTSFLMNDAMIFVIIKGRHIMVFQLGYEGHALKTYIHDSEDLAVTGLRKISEQEVLFSTKNGNIFILKTEVSSDNSLRSTQLKLIDSLRSDHYACFGMAFSKNKVMGAFAYSAYKAYDNSALKEPTQIIWCSMRESVSEQINDHVGLLTDIWDVMDIFRIESIQKNEAFPLTFEVRELDIMDISNLKKYLWLTQFSSIINNSEDIVARRNDIMTLLVSFNVFKRISSLLSTEISDFNMRSLLVMNYWLEFTLNTLDDAYEATKATAMTLLDQLRENKFGFGEVCSICSSDIPKFTGHSMAECSKGHTVPRCSLSLVQCDVTPYYVCNRCDAIAHPEAVEAEDTLCIFCDSLLKLDYKVE